MRFALITLLLVGCGAHPPPRTTDHDCYSSDIAETCWTCASEPRCGWWVPAAAGPGGCHADTEAPPGGTEVVHVSDLCNLLDHEDAL